MLATLTDYAKREGVPEDTLRTISALENADSYIKGMLGQSIESATTTVALEANGRRRLQLPEVPVTAVTAVTMGLPAVAFTPYRFTTDGGLYRTDRYGWPSAGAVTVTYTHGYVVIPDDLVALACRVARGLASDVGDVRSESVGSYSITYLRSATGERQLLSDEDRTILDRYRPVYSP